MKGMMKKMFLLSGLFGISGLLFAQGYMTFCKWTKFAEIRSVFVKILLVIPGLYNAFPF